MSVKRPNFLVIGAQKCGTSWLHKQLSAHPDIFMPPGKELEYFSYELDLHPAGIDGYLENFQAAGSARALGEATASYFWTRSSSPWCAMPDGFARNIPLAVKQQLGAELKLIVVLRNPARRALSAYLHYLGRGEIAPDATFHESMKYVGIIDMGFYARHLASWLEVFDRSNIMVLTLENDIQQHPDITMSRLHEFLNVEDLPQDHTALRQVVYGGTALLINSDGVFADLRALGSGGDVSRNGFTRVLTSQQWAELESIYSGDMAQLDTMLGNPLSADLRSVKHTL